MSPDARRFYPQLFGWTGRITPEPEAGGYTVFLLDGRAVAGAGPPAIPELGGTILVPPRDIPAGRYAGLRDPQGALFNVIAPARTGAG